jgi:hypothetical protein
MKIQIKEELLILLQSLAKLFSVVYGWMKRLTWLEPLPIEVTCCERTPIISIDDSIHIKHGNDVKLKVVLQVIDQLLFLFIFGVQKCVYQPVNHPRSACLTGMHPRS